jgi:hypothetical protein
MGQYRFYSLDREGRICAARNVDCAEDQATVNLATDLLNGHDIEVWERGRRVAHVKMSEQYRA